MVVNADDFGFTRDVNDGIVEAHRNGILTATTLMANGAEFEHAVTLARRHPSLDVGCHLVLVGGHSLLGREQAYPRDVAGLVSAMLRGQLDVEAELDAQIRRILSVGLRPTHLDTHKHTHLHPRVLHAVGKLSHQYRIPWVRRPFDYPMHAGAVPLSRRLLARGLGFLRNWFHSVLNSYGCRTTDHFAGFAVTGFYETPELVELLGQLPEGSTEFMTHPGFCTAELQQARTRLKETRQKELAALTAKETREAVERRGIRIVSYREL
ncbi:MAG: ChbG/HpnK family deacetylase [Bryobacterales bacterium]|nr:ChbG/HpnK family deacetylase [Bryobacterales bacterium]